MPALQRWFAGYFSLTEISLRLGFPQFGRALSELRACWRMVLAPSPGRDAARARQLAV